MQTDHQDSHSLSHAGHGQVVTLQQALYANSQHGGLATPITSANLPSSSSSSSIPGVPGLGTGYPLYRDTSGQLHLSDVGQAQAIASVQGELFSTLGVSPPNRP